MPAENPPPLRAAPERPPLAPRAQRTPHQRRQPLIPASPASPAFPQSPVNCNLHPPFHPSAGPDPSRNREETTDPDPYPQAGRGIPPTDRRPFAVPSTVELPQRRGAQRRSCKKERFCPDDPDQPLT